MRFDANAVINQWDMYKSAIRYMLRSSRIQPGNDFIVRQQGTDLIDMSELMNNLRLEPFLFHSTQDQIVQVRMNAAFEEHPGILSNIRKLDRFPGCEWMALADYYPEWINRNALHRQCRPLCWGNNESHLNSPLSQID
jgi:hypothetical protein